MHKLIPCAFLLLSGVFATPVKDELMFEGPDDTATVESTVREARAAPSDIGDLIEPGVKDAFLYVYGDAENDDGDVNGYSKRTDDKGQDGYKHKDSYHKQDGDKYGYEKHSEYGQENKANIENENEAGLKQAHFEADGDKSDETRNSYSVIEELNEDEDKKQPKKKIESEYDDGDSGGYFESDGDGESESYESSEGDDGEGDGKSYEESEESEDGDEEADDEDD